MFLHPEELKLTDKELADYTADQLVDLVGGKARDLYALSLIHISSTRMRLASSSSA